MKKVGIVTSCYNEEKNVVLLYQRIIKTLSTLKDYSYEILYIDNHSTDNTASVLRSLAKNDKHVKVIINTRNFGRIRSPFYGILQSKGDFVIYMASDLQDPPSLIPRLIQKWEQGFKVVMGVETGSKENYFFSWMRKTYYHQLQRLSDINLLDNTTGYGLYDREVIELIRLLNDPYPFFPGLVADLGYETASVSYKKPRRKYGITKRNFFSMFDKAMLGFTNHTKVPLRTATMLGFIAALVSTIIGLFYLIYKLTHWKDFTLGLAPLAVGLFFFSSLQLIFLGVIGEYIGAIYTQVLKRPLVIERERINFD